MDLREMLRRTEAPEALVDWAPTDVDEGFETCPSGSWLVWVAGSSGFPLDLLLRCVMELLDEVIDEVGTDFEGRDALVDALDTAQDCLEGEAGEEECHEASEDCEAMADEPPASYRDAAPPGFVELCRAVAWVPKAAEGFEASRLAVEAPRLDRANHMGSLLGAGSHIFLPSEQRVAVDAARLPGDEAQASMVYVVAALAEAVSHVEAAKLALSAESTEAARATTARWVADRLRSIARDQE